MYQLYRQVEMPETGEKMGTGWLPPLPDLGDYTEGHEKIKGMVETLNIPPTMNLTGLPSKCDWKKYCSPIESQGNLGSCTAHAGMGIVEYFERRAFDKHIDGSRLFVYKTTRNLMGVVGDTGSWLRNTMGALRFCGVPPEKYWPYTDCKQPGPGGERTFDEEPTAFVYSVADEYNALRYFCHDPLGKNVPADTVLARVKIYLAYGIPSMFGFWGFPSFGYTDVKGGIPYPCPGEPVDWGHAIVAVGYDDNMKITNTLCNKATTGALLIRNSWGTGWGDKGYGWLPYAYVKDKLAMDFWSLLQMEWVDTGNFGI
ncbi:C1 family peptidase [Candidatus Zixiibacteriota bacterium]